MARTPRRGLITTQAERSHLTSLPPAGRETSGPAQEEPPPPPAASGTTTTSRRSRQTAAPHASGQEAKAGTSRPPPLQPRWDAAPAPRPSGWPRPGPGRENRPDVSKRQPWWGPAQPRSLGPKSRNVKGGNDFHKHPCPPRRQRARLPGKSALAGPGGGRPWQTASGNPWPCNPCGAAFPSVSRASAALSSGQGLQADLERRFPDVSPSPATRTAALKDARPGKPRGDPPPASPGSGRAGSIRRSGCIPEEEEEESMAASEHERQQRRERAGEARGGCGERRRSKNLGATVAESLTFEGGSCAF